MEKREEDVRKRLRAIREDQSIAPEEKQILQKQILQELHAPNPATTRQDETSSCSHYPHKKCDNFYFECCARYYHCHRCHNEDNQNCPAPRFQLESIQCMGCQQRQKPAHRCEKCDLEFSKKYCSLCHIWTEKDSVHCDKCNVCRVGKADEIWHCDACQACFMESSRDMHVCAAPLSRDAQCPYCFGGLYHSQNPVVTLTCGHLIHQDCGNRALMNRQYRCPLCRCSMVDMSDSWEHLSVAIDAQPMPEEAKRACVVDCFDCRRKSTADFHYLGNRCGHCRGYNTVESGVTVPSNPNV